jgi:hypothetical protein
MSRRWFGVIAAGLAIAVLIALFSPLASSHPDGLEKVAEEKGFLDEGKDAPYSIIPDYALPGIENESVATILSGLIGIAIVAAICFGVPVLLRALGPRQAAPGDNTTAEQGQG